MRRMAVEIFFVIILVFIVLILIRLDKLVGQSRENSKPVLSELARVVAKRSDTKGNIYPHNGGDVSTDYYATFELETGKRLEFSVYAKDFGMLAEGDNGKLAYQGTRYRGFDRDLNRKPELN